MTTITNRVDASTRNGDATGPPHDDVGRQRLARGAGLAYLGLGISGFLGMFIRGELYVSGDAARTAANLVEREGLARFGIAVDLTVVFTQALAAWLLFATFRKAHATTAASIAGFGLVSAAILLVAAACSATALDVALDGGASAVHDAQLLYQLQGAAWQVGGLFFGLWLLPMGWLVLRSAAMPRALGWLLIAGGFFYILNTFVAYVLPDANTAADALLIPSTIGEVWMIGQLLVKGAPDRERRRDEIARHTPVGS